MAVSFLGRLCIIWLVCLRVVSLLFLAFGLTGHRWQRGQCQLLEGGHVLLAEQNNIQQLPGCADKGIP